MRPKIFRAAIKPLVTKAKVKGSHKFMLQAERLDFTLRHLATGNHHPCISRLTVFFLAPYLLDQTAATLNRHFSLKLLLNSSSSSSFTNKSLKFSPFSCIVQDIYTFCRRCASPYFCFKIYIIEFMYPSATNSIFGDCLQPYSNFIVSLFAHNFSLWIIVLTSITHELIMPF